MNISFLFYARPHLGGSGIMAMEAAKELARRGHNVDIVSYPGTHLSREEAETGVKIHPVPLIRYGCFKAEPFNLTLAAGVSNLAKEGRIPDVIHAHYAITHGDAALRAQQILQGAGYDPKVVITNHGSDVHTNGHHAHLAPGIQSLLNNADAVTYVSEALQREAQRIFELNSSGEVIRNFIDEDKFFVEKTDKKTLREKLGLPTNAVIVYHASNWRPVKRTERIIEAAKRLSQERPEIHFLLVGDGPEKTALVEKSLENYGLKNVTFVGRQDDVVPYTRASDISVLSSDREGCPIVTLETMACGIPNIAPKVGGIPEVIKHGQGGYLFEPNDVDSFVHYIKKLATNEELRTTQGSLAAEIISKSFSRRTIVDQYEKLYQDIIRQ